MPFARSEGRIPKFKETRDGRYIHQNELNKTCFQADMAYGDFKDYLDNQLLIKYYVIRHLILLKVQIMINIKAVLLSWLISF